MLKVMITNCDSDESPLRDFGIADGDVLDVEVRTRPDGSIIWFNQSWGDGIGIEIEQHECVAITSDNQSIH